MNRKDREMLKGIGYFEMTVKYKSNSIEHVIFVCRRSYNGKFVI